MWSAEDTEFMGSFGGRHTVAYEKEYCEHVLEKLWVGPQNLIVPEYTEADVLHNERIVHEWDTDTTREDPCQGARCCTGG